MPAQDDHQMCQDFADRIGLEGEDRDNFVKSTMTRLGYKPRTDWDDPDPEEGGEEEGEGEGDFFSRGKKKGRETRVVGKKAAPPAKGSSQYGYEE